MDEARQFRDELAAHGFNLEEGRTVRMVERTQTTATAPDCLRNSHRAYIATPYLDRTPQS